MVVQLSNRELVLDIVPERSWFNLVARLNGDEVYCTAHTSHLEAWVLMYHIANTILTYEVVN